MKLPQSTRDAIRDNFMTWVIHYVKNLGSMSEDAAAALVKSKATIIDRSRMLKMTSEQAAKKILA